MHDTMIISMTPSEIASKLFSKEQYQVEEVICFCRKLTDGQLDGLSVYLLHPDSYPDEKISLLATFNETTPPGPVSEPSLAECAYFLKLRGPETNAIKLAPHLKFITGLDNSQAERLVELLCLDVEELNKSRIPGGHVIARDVVADLRSMDANRITSALTVIARNVATEHVSIVLALAGWSPDTLLPALGDWLPLSEPKHIAIQIKLIGINGEASTDDVKTFRRHLQFMTMMPPEELAEVHRWLVMPVGEFEDRVMPG